MNVKEWLTPWLAAHLDDIQKTAAEVIEQVTEHQTLPNTKYIRRKLAEDCGLQSMRCSGLPIGYYNIQLFNEETVQALQTFTQFHRELYAVNDAEDEHYQMKELVLRSGGRAHYELAMIHDQVLRPLWVLLYGLNPTLINSIQYARYEPGENARTNWHYDQDSDCTVTVAIENGVGGGMEIFPGASCTRTEIGTATFFLGRTTLHRSRPVTEGERQLLVFWTGLDG